MQTYKLKNGRVIGQGQPCFIIAEIGLNHNGSLDNALKLIDEAVKAGCDAVKFQKRTPEVSTPREQWDVMRETPWGTMKYIDYRYKVEFGLHPAGMKSLWTFWSSSILPYTKLPLQG